MEKQDFNKITTNECQLLFHHISTKSWYLQTQNESFTAFIKKVIITLCYRVFWCCNKFSAYMTRYNNTNKQPSIYLVESKSMKKNKNVRLDDFGKIIDKNNKSCLYFHF